MLGSQRLSYARKTFSDEKQGDQTCTTQRGEFSVLRIAALTSGEKT
jgi:hypothetical protein